MSQYIKTQGNLRPASKKKAVQGHLLEPSKVSRRPSSIGITSVEPEELVHAFIDVHDTVFNSPKPDSDDDESNSTRNSNEKHRYYEKEQNTKSLLQTKSPKTHNSSNRRLTISYSNEQSLSSSSVSDLEMIPIIGAVPHKYSDGPLQARRYPALKTARTANYKLDSDNFAAAIYQKMAERAVDLSDDDSLDDLTNVPPQEKQQKRRHTTVNTEEFSRVVESKILAEKQQKSHVLVEPNHRKTQLLDADDFESKVLERTRIAKFNQQNQPSESDNGSSIVNLDTQVQDDEAVESKQASFKETKEKSSEKTMIALANITHHKSLHCSKETIEKASEKTMIAIANITCHKPLHCSTPVGNTANLDSGINKQHSVIITSLSSTIKTSEPFQGKSGSPQKIVFPKKLLVECSEFSSPNEPSHSKNPLAREEDSNLEFSKSDNQSYKVKLSKHLRKNDNISLFMQDKMTVVKPAKNFVSPYNDSSSNLQTSDPGAKFQNTVLETEIKKQKTSSFSETLATETQKTTAIEKTDLNILSKTRELETEFLKRNLQISVTSNLQTITPKKKSFQNVGHETEDLKFETNTVNEELNESLQKQTSGLTTTGTSELDVETQSLNDSSVFEADTSNRKLSASSTVATNKLEAQKTKSSRSSRVSNKDSVASNNPGDSDSIDLQVTFPLSSEPSDYEQLSRVQSGNYKSFENAAVGINLLSKLTNKDNLKHPGVNISEKLQESFGSSSMKIKSRAKPMSSAIINVSMSDKLPAPIIRNVDNVLTQQSITSTPGDTNAYQQDLVPESIVNFMQATSVVTTNEYLQASRNTTIPALFKSKKTPPQIVGRKSSATTLSVRKSKTPALYKIKITRKSVGRKSTAPTLSGRKSKTPVSEISPALSGKISKTSTPSTKRSEKPGLLGKKTETPAFFGSKSNGKMMKNRPSALGRIDFGESQKTTLHQSEVGLSHEIQDNCEDDNELTATEEQVLTRGHPVAGKVVRKLRARATSIKDSIIPPASKTNAIFKNFSLMNVSREALKTLNEGAEEFVDRMIQDVMMLARQDDRTTIRVDDIIKLFEKQQLINNKSTLEFLVHKYLPMEAASQILPVVMSGNKLMYRK